MQPNRGVVTYGSRTRRPRAAVASARAARPNVGHGLVAYLELRLVAPDLDEFVLMLKVFLRPLKRYLWKGYI